MPWEASRRHCPSDRPRKGELNFLAKIVAGVRGEVHISQATALVARPSAMHPRAFDQRIEDSRIVLIDGVKGPKWPGEIFGVEPSSNSQHRAVDVLHVWREIARLPVIVVEVVLGLVVPQETLSMKGS